MKDLDEDAWDQFVEVYSGVIFAYCRRCGFQDADASDIVQEVLASVAHAIRRFEYDPAKGAFRSWLFTICRNKIRTFAVKAHRRPAGAGGSEMYARLQAVPDDRVGEEIWNREHQLHLFAWAMNRVQSEFRESTWQAFLRLAVEQQTVDEISKDLNISAGAIYIAKSRVIKRIRREIEALEGT